MQTQHYLIFFLTFAYDSTSSKRRPTVSGNGCYVVCKDISDGGLLIGDSA